MQVKAQRERRAGAAGQLVFAAQIVAVGGQVKLARIGHAEARAIAVMGGRDPLMPAVLGALAAHRGRSPTKRAVNLDLDSISIADDQHRMRRARCWSSAILMLSRSRLTARLVGLRPRCAASAPRTAGINGSRPPMTAIARASA